MALFRPSWCQSQVVTVTLDLCLVPSDGNEPFVRHLAIKIQVCLSDMLGLFTQRFLTALCYAEMMVASFKQTAHQVVNCWAENAGFCWDSSPVRVF